MIEAGKGTNIYQAVKEAKEILATRYQYAYDILRFNEIDIAISANSLDEDIVTIYSLKSQIRRLKAGYTD